MNKVGYDQYKSLLLKLALLLTVYSCLRLLFYLNYHQTGGESLLLDFIFGLRFDLSAICLLMSPVILLETAPLPLYSNKIWRGIADAYFLIVIAVSTLLNLIDTAWFEYTGKRTTADFFSLINLGDDVNNNLGNYLLNYWYLLLVLIILLVLSFLLIKKINHRFSTTNNSYPTILSRIAIYIIIIGASFIGIRGGIQLRPISIQNAITGVNPNEVPLILNTPFTILKSWRDDPIPSVKFLDENQAKKIFNYEKNYRDSISFQKMNVVVLIMESFSKHLVGSFTNNETYTPFLDSLAKESLICTNAYANGKRSIEGIPAILSSIPHLTDEPFITGAYNVNRINSFASILGDAGYTTAFFHGGHNGTMGFDNYSKIAGYQNYYGKNEYKGKADDDDGRWGIYDDSFLNFMNEKISDMKEPFHSAFFSLSSHDPYVIPAKFKNKFPKGKEKYHESVRYADYALELFFKNAATKKWFNNTLFIIVADHTGPSNGDYYTNSAGQLAIPIMYYCPALKLKGCYEGITQQTDILPTTLKMLHYSGKFSAFGKPINDLNSFNMSYSNGIWQLINGKKLVQFDGEKTTGVYDLSNDSLLKKNLVNNKIKFNNEELLLKAYLQEFRNAMLTNTICKP
jgi:glucan phosphoethanolaminetransferase (alkaline phosphatase superfamily)